MTILMLALLPFLPVQSTATTAAGTWVAEHQGTTFIRLELTAANNTLTGAMGAGDVRVDDKGEVSQVTAVPTPLKKLLEVAVSGSSVSFVLPDDNDRDQFRLTVLGGDQAELAFLPDAELIEELKEAGIALPRPIRLRKIR
jgi:hypothetical protein